MIHAASYLRKSVEQVGVSDESTSITRQRENCRAFAAKMGWELLEEHEYHDTMSGAEWEKRSGFTRMMAALKPRPPFQKLIVSEQKSIGREMTETQHVIKRLAQAGVEVFEYMQGRSLTPRNSMDKMMSAIQSGADEMHREQDSARMHEAHARLARQGRCTGGSVYGYRNVHRYAGTDKQGNPLRSHVDREVCPEEAAVVLRIFELYAQGRGLRRIAALLTAEGARPPRYSPPEGSLPGLGGWSPSTVRAILGRGIYGGKPEWNRYKKRDGWGQVGPSPRPKSDLVVAEREDLRVVPEELWLRVKARRGGIEGRPPHGSLRLSGRPPKGEARNPLAGVASCGLCGGGIVTVTSTGPARGDAFDAEHLPGPGDELALLTRTPYRYLACNRRRQNEKCTNAMRVRADAAEEAVFQAIEEHVLTPKAVERFVKLTERDGLAERREALDAEQRDASTKIARLTAAIEEGGDAASVVARIRDLERRREEIAEELACLKPTPMPGPRVVKSRLAEWRRQLRGSPMQARAVLQQLLKTRLAFSPTEDGGVEFSGETRLGRLFEGDVLVLPKLQAPEWVPEGRVGMQADEERERLLQGAEDEAEKVGNVWRPWWDSNPRSRP